MSKGFSRNTNVFNKIEHGDDIKCFRLKITIFKLAMKDGGLTKFIFASEDEYSESSMPKGS